MSKATLQKAVQIAGGQSDLATRIRALLPTSKVTQAFVWKWLNSPSELTPPPEWVLPICEAVDWQITPHELRADIYPNITDALPAGLDLDRRAEERRDGYRREEAA